MTPQELVARASAIRPGPTRPAVAARAIPWHDAAPRTQAEAFCAQLRGAWGPMAHRELYYLGGGPRLPTYAGAMLEWFNPSLRHRDALAEMVRFHTTVDPRKDLGDLYALARGYGTPEGRAKVDANAATKARVEWVVRLGEDGVARALRGWALANAAELTHRGYVAGVLGSELAWELLLANGRCAQAEFASFGELFGAVAQGLALRSGSPSVDRLEETIEALCDRDPASPRRRAPWGTDLSSAAPPPLPEVWTSVIVRTSLECAACRAWVHVSRLEPVVTCPRCAARQALDARRWETVLTDVLFQARLHQDGVPRHFELADDELRAQRTWHLGAPACEACEAELDLDPLRADPTLAWVSCPCGARTSARRPDALSCQIDPGLLWIVGEETERPRAAAQVLAMSCIECAGRVDVDGSSRLVACGRCGARCFVSDTLWARFHPVEARRALSFVLVGFMQTVDLPKPSPKVLALGDGLSAATKVLDYRERFGLHAALDPPPLVVDPPLTRAQRWMLALGAADRRLAGLDQARIAGAPRSVGHRVDAMLALSERFELKTAEAWRSAVKREFKPSVQRVRRQCELLRLGYSVGWIEAHELFRVLAPLAERLQGEHADFAAYASAHKVAAFSTASPEALREAGAALLADPCSPWSQLDWRDDLASSAAFDESQVPGEWLCVRASVACPRCLGSAHLEGLGASAPCARCGHEVPLDAYSWRERLELPIAIARTVAPGELQRMTDHRTDGAWTLEVGRVDPRCGNCDGALVVDPLGSEPSAVLTCSACNATASLRPAADELRSLDPRARVLLTHHSSPSRAGAIVCPGCGAGLHADGGSRTLVCGHCRVTSWMSDRDWLRLHPPGGRKGFYVLVSKDRDAFDPRLAEEAEHESRAVLVQGVPMRTGSRGRS